MNTTRPKILKLLTPLLLAAAAGVASANPVTVAAFANSSKGGTPLSTGLLVTAGQTLRIDVNTSDLWGAKTSGAWANANGLNTGYFATGTDESGAAAGTQIGWAGGNWTQFGFTAPYASLVGEIGGKYFLVGTHYEGQAAAAGELRLMFWDSDTTGNRDFITANVSVVPEPSGVALAGLGLSALGLVMRRKSQGRRA